MRSEAILSLHHRGPPSRFRAEPTASAQRALVGHALSGSCRSAFGLPHPRSGSVALVGMPTYGYRGPNGHEFEVVHGMGGSPPTACEVCGAAPVIRVFYPISVSFTGSGSYATDCGRSEQRPEVGDGEPACQLGGDHSRSLPGAVAGPGRRSGQFLIRRPLFVSSPSARGS
ncbi:MAG: FmdB family zinc ribbon protein [Gaiellaceae bacterium]